MALTMLLASCLLGSGAALPPVAGQACNVLEIPGCHLWRATDLGAPVPADATWTEGRRVVTNHAETVVFKFGGTFYRGLVQRDDIAVIAYDASTGQSLWTFRTTYLPESCCHREEDIIVSHDDAKVYFSAQGDTGHIVALDAFTGKVIWDTTHPGRIRNLILSSDGGTLFIGGHTNTGIRRGINYEEAAVAAALDAHTGERHWEQRIQLGWKTQAWQMELSPRGEMLYLAGYNGWTEASGFTADLLVVAVETGTGATEWISTYDGPSHGLDMAARVGPSFITDTLSLTPDGSALVVLVDSEYGWALVTYDASTGAELVSVRRNGSAAPPGPLPLKPTALALSPDGSTAYAVGIMWPAVILLEARSVATGELLWERALVSESVDMLPGFVLVGKGGTTLYVGAGRDPTPLPIVPESAERSRTGIGVTAVHSPSGAPLWSTTVGTDYATLRSGVIGANTGHLYLTGWSDIEEPATRRMGWVLSVVG